MCFGAHDLGQLGVGGAAPDVCDTLPCALTPQRVTDLAAARRVVAGDQHTCVLLEDDTLRCFGSDERGQLGNSMGAVDVCGAIPCARTPRAVVQLEGEGVVRVAASGDHTVFVTADALVQAFGSNAHRECAANTPDPLTFPQRIYGIAAKGRLTVGYDADFTLVDLKREHVITDEEQGSRVGWTPFAGWKVKGWPVRTIVRGRSVMIDGQLQGAPGGRAVRFVETLQPVEGELE